MPHIEQIPIELALQIRHLAMYPDKELTDVKLQDDADGIHFGLFENNKLVSVGSWFRRNESEAQFRKLATVEEYRNSGLGTLLLQYLIDFSKAEKIKILWCNARVNALTFYKRAGFNETGQVFTKDGIDYIIIQLELT
jgi:predicted GNAT family N-acyltransferase